MILKAANDNSARALGRIIALRIASVGGAVLVALVSWAY